MLVTLLLLFLPLCVHRPIKGLFSATTSRGWSFWLHEPSSLFVLIQTLSQRLKSVLACMLTQLSSAFTTEPVPNSIRLSTTWTDDRFSVDCASNFIPRFVQGLLHLVRSCQERFFYLFSHLQEHVSIGHWNVGFHTFRRFHTADRTEICVFRNLFATFRTEHHTDHLYYKRKRVA